MMDPFRTMPLRRVAWVAAVAWTITLLLLHFGRGPVFLMGMALAILVTGPFSTALLRRLLDRHVYGEKS